MKSFGRGDRDGGDGRVFKREVLHGDEPCVVDLYAITMLFFMNSCVEFGSAVPAGAVFVSGSGAPSLLPYIRLWMQRESFAYCYHHTHEISAASVNNLIRMLADERTPASDGEVYA